MEHTIRETTVVERICSSEAKNMEEFSRQYFERMYQFAESIDPMQIRAAADLLQQAHARDAQILVMGNGGSAAVAHHFAADFAKNTKAPGARPFRVLSLNENNAYLTAQSNDEGYHSVFVAQLENFLRPDDVVIMISSSGNSPNIALACEYARAHGAKTIGFTGFDGGKLKNLCDVSIVVPTPKGYYAEVEDIHMNICHILILFLGAWLAKSVQQ